MVRLKAWWQGFINVAVLLSFVFNFIFIIVLIIVVILVFDIKRGLVQPLVDGLHSSFVGLDQATIITTIKVSDTVPVDLSIPLQTNTVVVLTDNVPVRANASFNLPGGGGTINGAVSIVLPTGLRLPVSLDLTVPVHDHLPVNLTVPVNIKLADTQLHDPFNQLRVLLEPYVRLLGNLPNGWGDVIPFIVNVANGTEPNLLRSNDQSRNPWPGFHTGLGPPNTNPTAPPLATAPVDSNNGGSSNPAATPLPPSNGVPTVTTAAPLFPSGPATRVDDLGIITPVPH